MIPEKSYRTVRWSSELPKQLQLPGELFTAMELTYEKDPHFSCDSNVS